MDKTFKISLYEILITLLVITLTVLLIIEVRVKEESVVETIESNNVKLFDEFDNELDCIKFDNLNPYEEIIYYVKLTNYNVENLEYRVVFDLISSIEILECLEVRFNNELLEFTNYKGVSDWYSTNNEEECFSFSLKYNSSNNEYQNLLIGFDFRIESVIS